MSKTISNSILELRKEKGLTQEQLANSVMVSAQAVSKWENGGMPDAELLPAIADSLGVTVDELFGRSITSSDYLMPMIHKLIKNTNSENRFKVAFELCWDIESALAGCDDDEYGTPKPLDDVVKEVKDRYKKDTCDINTDCENALSTVTTDQGFTAMSLFGARPYFFIAPESDDSDKSFIDDIDYVSLFKDLSDKNFFDALIFLNKRWSSRAFTPNLLVKNIGVDHETAKNVLAAMKKYGFIATRQVERDDEIEDEYVFITYLSGAALSAMLMFAREVIKPTAMRTSVGGERSKAIL